MTVERADSGLMITVEPYLTSSAIVTVSDEEGARPPVFTSMRTAMKIAAGLLEPPGRQLYPDRVRQRLAAEMV